jgi:ABC-type transporter Mla MlaB component
MEGLVMHNMTSSDAAQVGARHAAPIPDASASWTTFNPLTWLDDDNHPTGLNGDILGDRDHELRLPAHSDPVGRDWRKGMGNERNDGTGLEPADIPVQDAAAEQVSVVDLGERIKVRDVEGLRQTLVARLTDQAIVQFDCSRVESADASALQLLTAFYREASNRGVKVYWHEPSEALRESAALLGLSEELELPRNTEK